MNEIKNGPEKERRDGERRSIEKRETARELDELLHLAQEIGGRLANEIHGDAYENVRKLNELIHEAHGQLMIVQQELGVFPVA